jgi:hypothetical protein
MKSSYRKWVTTNSNRIFLITALQNSGKVHDKKIKVHFNQDIINVIAGEWIIDGIGRALPETSTCF